MLEEKRKTGMVHYIILKIIILKIVHVLVVASIYYKIQSSSALTVVVTTILGTS